MSLDPILPPKTIKTAPETLEISFDRVSVLSPLVSHSALIETCFVDSKPICHLQGNGYEVLENKMEEIENHLSWIMTALKLIITINRNNIHGKLKLFLWSNFNIYSINKSYFCFYMKVLDTFCDFKAFILQRLPKINRSVSVGDRSWEHEWDFCCNSIVHSPLLHSGYVQWVKVNLSIARCNWDTTHWVSSLSIFVLGMLNRSRTHQKVQEKCIWQNNNVYFCINNAHNQRV